MWRQKVCVAILSSCVFCISVSAAANTSIELISKIEGVPPLEDGPNKGSWSWVSPSADGRFIAVGSPSTNLSTDDTNGLADVYVYGRDTGSLELLTAGGNGSSSWPAMSDDGRIVAFHSSANNLAPGDANDDTDVYVYDRDTGTTELLTAGGNQRSVFPRISGNGRFVAFVSSATNLVAGDTNERDDILVVDRDTEVIKSITAGANSYSWRPSLSQDGRFVAFQSNASNLVTGDTNGVDDIFVHDSATDTIQRLTTGANGSSAWPSISGDGRFVVFESNASNLVAGDFNGLTDIFIHDRDLNTTELLTAGANRRSGDATISVDGLFVTFRSQATNLVPNSNDDGGENIFVYDRTAEVFELVTLNANSASIRPKISGGGRYISFQTESTNLVSRDNNGSRDVLDYDRTTGIFERVPNGGIPFEVAGGNGKSGAPSVNASGQFVAFESSASDMVINDSNGHDDIYVYDRNTDSNQLITPSSNMGSRDPSINESGRFIAFESAASNLVSGDTNGRTDILVYDQETANTEALTLGANADSLNPSISADGRFVTFESDADNLTPGDTNGGTRDIFLYDRETDSTALLTAGGNGESKTPTISADGRFVAYASQANNLVATDTTANIFDIFVYNRITGTTELLTAGGNNWSLTPSISADGRFVAFESDASNLASGDVNGTTHRDIYVHDRENSTTELLTAGSSYSSFAPSISGNGRFVAFSSEADDLVAEDTSIGADIFVYDRDNNSIKLLTEGADGNSSAASISGNGSVVAFTSLAINLANDGTLEHPDVFVSVINNPPIADALTAITDEDTPVAITASGSDADEESLTFEITSQPANGEITGAAPNWLYTPNSDFSGADSFTYSASDGTSMSLPTTVTITVVSVNDAPVGTGATDYVTPEDTPVSITLEGADVEGDMLTYSIASQPNSGTLFGTVPNLIYSPAPNFNGSDQFSFAVSDGALTSNTTTVNLSVLSINDTPVAAPASLATAADAALAITLQGSDADNDVLSFSISSFPANGNLSGTLPNLLYTPSGSFIGEDSFTFTVSDNTSTSVEARITIEISEAAPPPPSNAIPVADSQALVTQQESSVNISLTGSDADGDPLSFTIVSLPSNGSLSGTAPNLVYAPDAGYAGQESFSFTVSDAEDESTPATVFITVIDTRISLLAAVLPGSRSVEVGATATAFATLINAGTADAEGCGLGLPNDLPATFFYQATDAATNAPLGQPNLPVDIPAGTASSFVFGITPSEAFAATNVSLTIHCANASETTSFVGLNTLLLSAAAAPVPDLVALVATVTNNGVMELAANSGFFSAATINVGSAATISVSADTGDVTLPITLSLCQTDPATAVCINPTIPGTDPVELEIAAGDSPTFAVFANASEPIALDPANRRVFLRFSDQMGEVRGATSVAIENLP